MNQLVIVCPVCGDSIIMRVERGVVSGGAFTSRCGTKISFQIDSCHETETARIAELKARAKGEFTIK
jgi:hypothetical protein